MVLFKRRLLKRVLQRRKTQTRRRHKRKLRVGRTYPINDRWFSKPQGHIKINNRFPQRLRDVSEEEARAEGYNNLTEFLEDWVNINGYLIPWQTVTAYDFELVG